MYRRDFLHAVGISGATAGASLPGRADDRTAGSPRTGDERAASPRGTGHERAADRPRTNATTTTATPTRTPTPTPTETQTQTPTPAVATPSTGFEPLGSVEIRNGAEAVLTPDGRTAFVAVGDGFAAVDVSHPARPGVIELETHLTPPGADAPISGVQDVNYDDGELLVAGPASREEHAFYGVALFDVTDPTEPAFRRAHGTDFPVHNCFLADGIGYLTGNNRVDNPLVIVDVREGRELARWSILDHDDRWGDVDRGLRTLHDVWVHGGLAYLAYWDAGTWMLDVSDPADPRYVGNVTTQSPGDLAEESGLDATRASGQPPGNDHYVATDGQGLLAIGKESWDSGFGEEDKPSGYEDTGGPSGIHLYDVADPTTPEKLSEIAPLPTADTDFAGVWTTAHNFDVHDGYLYSSWYRGGVRVHDVTEPVAPRQVAHFRRSRTTSFWTAQLARAGDCFVGMSHRDPRDRDRPGTLYTFPDPRTAATTPTGTPTTTPTPTPTRGSTDPGSGTPDRDGSGTTGAASTTGGGGPGFGPLAGLTALGVGAWRLLGRESGDRSE